MGKLESVNAESSYGINIMHFIDRNSGESEERSRIEFRVKGASQY